MSDPHPQSKGWLLDLVASIFSYIDRPWKAVVVVVLILLGGFGLVVYDKRDELFEAWFTPSEIELKTAEIPAALDKLREDADEAELIQIWSVDIHSLSQTFRGARRRDNQPPVIPKPRTLPLIDDASDIVNLAAVMQGQPACAVLKGTGSPLVRRLSERGFGYGCAIPIMPRFVGMIYIAWAEKPSESEENVALSSAREIARTLATH